MAWKYCYNKFVMKFFWEKEDEDKRRQKNGQTIIFFQNCLFETYI